MRWRNLHQWHLQQLLLALLSDPKSPLGDVPLERGQQELEERHSGQVLRHYDGPGVERQLVPHLHDGKNGLRVRRFRTVADWFVKCATPGLFLFVFIYPFQTIF